MPESRRWRDGDLLPESSWESAGRKLAAATRIPIPQVEAAGFRSQDNGCFIVILGTSWTINPVMVGVAAGERGAPDIGLDAARLAGHSVFDVPTTGRDFSERARGAEGLNSTHA